MRDGKIIVARLWPKYGGDIPSRASVICGINPQKYETICIYHTKNSDNPNVFEQNGKKVFYLTTKPSLGFLRFFAILKLAILLKKQKVDIFHCHHHKSIVYGAIAGKLAGVPVIIAHVHGLGRTRNINRKLLNLFVLPCIDRILAVGQAVKEDIIANNPTVKSERIINLGNSIDYDYYSHTRFDRTAVRGKFNIPQDAFVFATAGRLAETKGQKFLIDAFAQVKKQIPNALLIFAGAGELKDALEKQSAKLGCGDSIRFPGRVNNMLELYCATDAFVLPSIAEGLPRGLMEAMAAGVLCIASNAGGIPEILDGGKFGYLVEPRDANSLCLSMLKVADMPCDEKMKMISAAKEQIRQNFSHGVMIKREEKIYDELAKNLTYFTKPR
ncbi:MAG: glycosyltransferase [Phycisphaerae bacterium]|jgi:glycosyltransferase involved in cell wall biosynthesis